jgi:lipoyl(octanoyl) transferase
MRSFDSKNLGLLEFADALAMMERFTELRDANSRDEIWFVEHPPIYTLGLNADRSHVLSPGRIPVVQTNRGGQVTYHGPGQQIVYVMLDLGRLGLHTRSLVETLENAVIDTVAAYGVRASSRRDAPGVYVDGAKLAAVGLRIRRGRSFHGLAVNVNLDLEPFERINPCGMAGLRVTQLSALCDVDDLATFALDFEEVLDEKLRRLSPARKERSLTPFL